MTAQNERTPNEKLVAGILLEQGLYFEHQTKSEKVIELLGAEIDRLTDKESVPDEPGPGRKTDTVTNSEFWDDLERNNKRLADESTVEPDIADQRAAEVVRYIENMRERGIKLQGADLAPVLREFQERGRTDKASVDRSKPIRADDLKDDPEFLKYRIKELEAELEQRTPDTPSGGQDVEKD